MFRKKSIILVLLIINIVFLVSCTNETVDKPNTGSSKGINLDLRITWKAYSGRGEAIQKIVDTYNEKYSGESKITMVDGDEDQVAVGELLNSNSEMIFVLPYRYVKYFGGKGDLINLSDDFNEEKKVFYEEVWNLGSIDGHTYGIPWLGHSMCLLYNKNLLEKAGVDANSINSLEALVEAIELIKEKTGAYGLGLVGAESNDVSWMVNQFIYGYGSSLVSDDGKSVTINNEKSKAALNMYKNVLGKYAQPTWIDDTAIEVMEYFANNKVAFEILGIWGVIDIVKNGSPFEVGIISMQDIGLCSEVGPMMLALPAGMTERNKEEAIKFIKYMASKEAQEEILKGEYSPEHDAYYPFRMPIRFDMTDTYILRVHPEYQTFIEGFRCPSIDVPVPQWQIIKDNIYEVGLHKVMIGELTIDEFLAMVETQGNDILSSNED